MMALAAAATAGLARAEQAADARLQKTAGPVKLTYTMPLDGFATLVIENEQGIRVRNLIGGAPRAKGEQTDYWDCTGEDGKPVAPGKYRFRGLLHKGIEPVLEASYGPPAAPPKEGWHAVADPDDKTRVFAAGTEFKLDYAAGKATVVAGDLPAPAGQLIKAKGREYILTRNGRLFLRTGKTAKLVAAVDAFMWREAKSFSEFPVADTVEWEANGDPSGHHWLCSTSFLWSDLNDDGKAQPEETIAGSCHKKLGDWQFPIAFPPDITKPHTVPPGGMRDCGLDENFNLYTFGIECDGYGPGQGPLVVRFPFKGWTPGGAPIWDTKNQKLLGGAKKAGFYDGGLVNIDETSSLVLPNGKVLFSKGRAEIFTLASIHVAAEGTVVVGPPLACLRDDGTVLWTYKDDWSGMLFWNSDAPLSDRDDVILGPLSSIGSAKTAVGTVFALQTLWGRMHLMTVDGLFVASVFQDFRRPNSAWPADAKPGTAVGGVSMGRDWSGGCFFKTTKGSEYYVIAGSAACNVIKLNGLDSLQAIKGGELTVTAR